MGADRARRAALDELASRLAEAARAAFEQAREAHPGESFYCYALFTGALMDYILPTCSSEEGLREVARVYAGELGHVSAEQIDDLRWSPADSPHHLLGEHHFDGVGELLAARGDPWELEDDELGVETGLRREACFRALARLDGEGFFGRGDERDQVVVTVLQGDQSDRSRRDNARRLNPPAALARLERYLDVPEPIGEFTTLGSGPVYQVTALALAADARSLVACASGGELFAWDIADGREVPADGREVPADGREVPAGGREVLAVRHDAAYWRAAVSADGRVLVLRDGRAPVLVGLPDGTRREIGVADAWDVAVSPDGTVLVAAGGTVRAHEVGTWRELWRLDRPASAVRFSGDGALLAVAGDGAAPGVAVVGAADGSPVRELLGEGRHCTAWSADGRVLAAGDLESGAVRLWHRDGRAFTPGRTFGAGAAEPADLAFSPDGTLLAAACAGGDVHVWEAGTGRHVRRLRGWQESMHAVVWLDGSRLAAAGCDVDSGPPVYVWTV